MKDCNVSTTQGLTASLAVSVTLLILEQILASIKRESNSLAQFVLNTVRTMRAQNTQPGTVPHPTPPPTEEFQI